MRRQSGICMELNQDRSIFLMENGQFIKGTPTGNPSIGEEAFFYPYEKKPAVRWQPIMAPVIAAVAALALFMSVLVAPAEEAFGYVQVQINPGVELGINDQYEVVSIRELNSDGHELIHQLDDWENDSLLDVLSRVFELAVTEQTEQITITAVEEDDSDFDKAIKNVVLAVSSGAKNNQMAIQMKEATKAQWRQSREDHVPVGQLIKKTETLKIQRPDVQKSGKETETVTDPKENKAVPKQNPQKKNDDKETKNTKPTDENKTIPPGVEKKAVPPAVEKKQGNPSPKTEQQKTPKPNRKTEEPAAKTEKVPPVKAQEKVAPNKPAPKEKPAEKKEKNPSENKEKNGSENKTRPNNGAPGQQKNNEKAAANSNSIHKTETQPSSDQGKKNSQAPDHSNKDEKQGQKKNGNSSNPQNKQGNKEKE